MQKKLFTTAFFLVLVVFLVHVLALKFYWYSAIDGFDKWVHLAGGMFISIVTGALFYRYFQKKSSVIILGMLLFSVLIVGIGWELFEYIIQDLIRPLIFATISDSIGDLVFDLAGGFLGACFVWYTQKQYNGGHE